MWRPFARIVAFRDAAGVLKRLRYDGDIQRCSHPPQLWFDAAGTQVLAIPNHPVAKDSPEAAGFAAQQAEQTAGLVEAERLACPD